MSDRESSAPGWTPAQRDALAREYARIGVARGQLLPTPRRELTPDEALALFRSIPDGAGLQGYVDAVGRLSRKT